MSTNETPSGSGEPVLAWIARRTATYRQRDAEFDDPRLEYRRLFSEVWGTFLLVLVAAGGGVIGATAFGSQLTLQMKALAPGMMVMGIIFFMGTISGAHLNPAVTLGFWISGVIDGGDVPKYLIGEFLGAFAGASLVVASYWDHFKETEDPGLKLAVFCTGPAIRNYPLNLVTEIVGTFVLVFGVLAIAVANKAGVGLIAGGGGLIVGLLVFAIGLSLGGPTGYAINPARDLGPRIMHAILPVPGKGSSDWSYAWVPVLGPLIGGALGGLAYNWWYPL